jgi:hypothetical protein
MLGDCRFQVWISELSLTNAAQMAEQPDPTRRSFQSGEAWRGFQKYFGKATDSEMPHLFSDLMQFGDCDDPLANHILHSAFPLSNEHSEPDGCFSPPSELSHWASRTFTTNQPSSAGARPEPLSSSRASGMAQLYK